LGRDRIRFISKTLEINKFFVYLRQKAYNEIKSDDDEEWFRNQHKYDVLKTLNQSLKQKNENLLSSQKIMRRDLISRRETLAKIRSNILRKG
jgi:hypothetical protein